MIDFLNDIGKKKLFSLAALFLVSIYYINETSINKKHWQDQAVIQSDAANYYIYLPAYFIYDDLKYEFTDSINAVYQRWIAPYTADDDGNRFQKFTAGAAVLYSPFFLIAHQLSLNDDSVSADGYTEKYHQWILYGSLFYAILALAMIRLVVGIYFDDLISAAVLLFIGLGTNFMFYATFEGGLSHTPGLFLVASYVYCTIKWFEKGKLVHLSLLLLSLSVATVMRPTNFLFIIFFLAYFFEKKDRIKWTFKRLWSYKFGLILPLVLGLIPGLLQMALWKYNSGSYVLYSYEDESFFFLKPHVLLGLFSARNSLFLYSLPFVLSIIGLFIWNKKIPNLSIVITLTIFYYVIYSWWCWWYGGSYGSRAAIESYVFLAILLGVAIHFIIKNLHSGLALLAIASMMVVFGTTTQRFTDLRKSSVLHYDAMTWEAYLYLWKNDPVGNDYFELWESPDYKGSSLNGEEYVGFQELNTRDRYTEELQIKISSETEDSLFIQYEFWGQNAFFRDPVVYLELLNEEINVYQRLYIKPDLKRIEWNIGVKSIPVEQEWIGQTMRLRVIYEGKRRIFYKPIVEITNKLLEQTQ